MAKDNDNKVFQNGASGRPAVIYCRTAKHGNQYGELEAQEARCRAYAEQRGLLVLDVFKDSVSGSSFDRLALNNMLGFMRERSSVGVIVIADDISRFARGIKQHYEICGAIADAGGVVETPTLAVGGDADSILLEHVLLSVATHQKRAKESLP